MTTSAANPTTELVAAFSRLFDNEFLTLDGVMISYRAPEGIFYLDEDIAIDAMLFGREAATLSTSGADERAALHLALFDAAADAECVVSGWSRHLRALLLEGYPPPPPTSMMQKRGIPDLSAHLVEPDGLAGPGLAASVARAQRLADRHEMRHLLLCTSEGMVAIAGAPFDEAVSHWHNVEFAAQVECLAIEERYFRGARTDRSER